MDRRGWLTAGVAALGLAFVALVASSEPIRLFHDPTVHFDFELERRRPPEPRVPELTGSRGGDWSLPLLTPGLERILIVVLLVVLALLIFMRVRRFLRELAPGEEPEFDVLPDVQAALAEAAAEQRHHLLTGTPRNAIVACWVRLEDVIEQAGLVRNQSDTSTELTARVLSTYVVDRRAIDELAALYREARFSTHELSEDHRQRAVNALDELHAQLSDPRSAVPSAQ